MMSYERSKNSNRLSNTKKRRREDPNLVSSSQESVLNVQLSLDHSANRRPLFLLSKIPQLQGLRRVIGRSSLFAELPVPDLVDATSSNHGGRARIEQSMLDEPEA